MTNSLPPRYFSKALPTLLKHIFKLCKFSPYIEGARNTTYNETINSEDDKIKDYLVRESKNTLFVKSNLFYIKQRYLKVPQDQELTYI